MFRLGVQKKKIIANYNYTTNRRIQEKIACVNFIDDISCSVVFVPLFNQNIFTGLISSYSIFIFRHPLFCVI